MNSSELLYPEARLMLFARAPEAGRVKTRLAPLLGEDGALDLYCQLLKHQLAVVTTQRLCPAELWVAGDLWHPRLPAFEGSRHVQVDGDLGERMLAAVTQGFRAGASPLLVIGSDCPAIDQAYLARALQSLEQDAEVVLGPALDGGYVLIGLKRPQATLFQDIDWGSDRVLAQTEARLQAVGLRYCLLPALRDIDRPEDLAGLERFQIYPRISKPWLAAQQADRRGES